MRILSIAALLLLSIPAAVDCGDITKESDAKKHYDNGPGLIQGLGDPFVFQHEGVYYLYGTSDTGGEGIPVYQSDDLIHWGKPAGARDGYALHRDDVWGSRWFWSPEVFHANGKFYMIYTVEERLAVATSSSPLGPFTQPRDGPINADIKEIGHKTLRENAKTYIYFSRLEQGNVIYGAEMTDDLLSFKEGSLIRLLDSSKDWEHTPNNPDAHWPVAEAPFVMKHKGLYYLFYTANHFISPDYAVGYATSASPLGPFRKYEVNPILKSTASIKGTGTTSIVRSPGGELYMFYHAHGDLDKALPRKICMDRVEFVAQPDGAPDTVRVHGPTVGRQAVRW
jgi:beta-xylosidase